MPARRTGKAASRQSRQRRQQQRSTQRAQLQRSEASPADAGAATPPQAGGASATAQTRPAAAPARAPRSDQRPAVSGSSRLDERAHLEYHYVGRDLRNIGVLVAIIVAVLIVATIALNALGVGPR